MREQEGNLPDNERGQEIIYLAMRSQEGNLPDSERTEGKLT
jgi:hypothetical protein